MEVDCALGQVLQFATELTHIRISVISRVRFSGEDGENLGWKLEYFCHGVKRIYSDSATPIFQ